VVALILVSADEFWSFFCVNSSSFSRSTRQFMTPDRHRRRTMCTATSTWLVTALQTRGPGWSLWASGRTARRLAAGLPASTGIGLVRRVRGRQTAPCHFVQEQAGDILVPPLLRICLTLYYISLFWLLSPPPLRNSVPCNGFDYLGHF